MGAEPDTEDPPEDVNAGADEPRPKLDAKRPWSVVVLAAVLAAGAYALYDDIVTPVHVPPPKATARGPILGLDDEATRADASPPKAAPSIASVAASISPPPSAVPPLSSRPVSTGGGLRGTGQ